MGPLIATIAVGFSRSRHTGSALASELLSDHCQVQNKRSLLIVITLKCSVNKVKSSIVVDSYTKLLCHDVVRNIICVKISKLSLYGNIV